MTFKNFMAYTFGGGWKVYSKRIAAQVEADAGYYKGRLWKIVSCSGMYPLVYVEGDEEVYTEDGIGSPAHGDITFKGPRYDLGMPSAIGWDYCHSGDFIMMQAKHAADPKLMKKLTEGRLYSMRAIKKNIKETIKWLDTWRAEHEDR